MPSVSTRLGLGLPAVSMVVAGVALYFTDLPLRYVPSASPWHLSVVHRHELALVIGVTVAALFLLVVLPRRYGVPILRELSPRRASVRALLMAGAAGVGLGFLTVLAHLLLSPGRLQPLVTPPYSIPHLTFLIVNLGIGALTAPVYEEIFYRRLLYLWFRRYLPVPFAILVGAALFGLSHGIQLNAVASGILGLVACVFYERTGALFTCVCIHIVDTLTIHALQILIFWPAILP